MATHWWGEGLDKHCSSGFKMHMVNTFLVVWKSASFQDKFSSFPPPPLLLHEGVRLNGESVGCQEFLYAISRGEWTLVGNSRRVTEPSMKGKCRQESLRQTGKSNPLSGSAPSTRIPLGQKREKKRKKEVLLQCLLSSSQWCGNLAIPFQWSTICLDLGTWTHLKCPGAPFYLFNYLGIQFPINHNCSTPSGERAFLPSWQNEKQAFYKAKIQTELS